MALPGTLTDLSFLLSTAPYGFDWVTGTTARTGQWFAIVALTDPTALAALTGKNVPANVAGMPLPVGLPVTGDFTSITLQSGQVLAYRYE